MKATAGIQKASKKTNTSKSKMLESKGNYSENLKKTNTSKSKMFESKGNYSESLTKVENNAG